MKTHYHCMFGCDYFDDALGTHYEKRRVDDVKDVLKLLPNENYTVDMKFTGRNAKKLTRPVDRPIQTMTTVNNLRLVRKELFSKKYTGIPIDTQQGRQLTNDDYRILQGFPKSYKFYGSKQSIKRQICNAVPPPLIKIFFEQITKKIEIRKK